MPRTEVEIAIVGAGAAGLAAAATLDRRGHEATVLEADGYIGARWASRYERLRLHTVRRYSGLPFRGLQRGLPKYVSKDDYAGYLADYAEALGLDVRLGQRVERVEPLEHQWRLRTSRGELRAKAVVVATGRQNGRSLPAWPGLESFRGGIVHSGEYASGREYAGLRALVVGIGNSGAEIATDLVEHGAASVAVAVRTSPPIAKRDILGVPVQLLGILLMPFPAKPVDRLGAVVRRLGTGDLRPYGLRRPEWGPFEARRPPLIDVGFLETLKRGGIRIRPDLSRMTPEGVIFADGSEEPFDLLVAATGFATGLEELFDLAGVLDERGLPRAREDGSTIHPGLYFVGFRESPRGALFEVNRDSRRLADSVSRYLA